MRTGIILCPTDFSETASHGLSYAVEMANLYGVGLRILNVVIQPLGVEESLILNITPQDLFDSMEKAAAEKMANLLENLNTDLEVTSVIRQGAPVDQIIEEAEESNVGMIVMASHGRTGFSHFLHVNVAEDVANRAKCPVMIVK